MGSYRQSASLSRETHFDSLRHGVTALKELKLHATPDECRQHAERPRGWVRRYVGNLGDDIREQSKTHAPYSKSYAVQT